MGLFTKKKAKISTQQDCTVEELTCTHCHWTIAFSLFQKLRRGNQLAPRIRPNVPSAYLRNVSHLCCSIYENGTQQFKRLPLSVLECDRCFEERMNMIWVKISEIQNEAEYIQSRFETQLARQGNIDMEFIPHSLEDMFENYLHEWLVKWIEETNTEALSPTGKEDEIRHLPPSKVLMDAVEYRIGPGLMRRSERWEKMREWRERRENEIEKLIKEHINKD